jgi:MFS family permease
MPISSRIARAGLWIAIAGAIALALAPVGYRMGAWSLGVAFYYGIGGATVAGGVAVIVSLIAAILARRAAGAAGFGTALAGVVIGAIVGGYPATQIAAARSVPAIHDITTDVANPPVFVALAAARKAAPNGLDYEGAAVAGLQKQAYPDITTLRSRLAPAELFDRAAKLAVESGWEVAAAVPAEGRIEATATTRMFGFKDDVVIRVRPAEGGSELDMRSMSRLGKSDIGTNAARIRAFMKALKAADA